ncbi:excisionase family DNA binding protein [Rhodococcus percolatus]|uniref:excisionase family DNA-binding protein n=1 Tax=Rhodococcus opacus TaxID=37919 RepID=UPI0017E1A2C6|nr:excisionase family DNA-binding protein [Rhodococcus opacus]MBA8964761.1 excisionase family DNA binding protein [Rhodococcus opacus]MBP2208313.1 excisionase family DNA binding protein [Rhodococcus opacus]
MRIAAEQFGVSERTIRRRIADGSLRAYRMGPRMIRIDTDQLDEVLRPLAA